MFGTIRSRYGARRAHGARTRGARTGGARTRGTRTGGARRARLLAIAAVAALGVSVLTGCAAGQIDQTSNQVPNHAGGHGRAGQITVDNALIDAAKNMDGAVAYQSGSNAPLTFWITNRSDDPDTLTSMTSSIGTVTIDGDATVKGQSYLQVGGSSDVSATIESISKDLKYGFPVKVTFYFKHAGKITTELPMAIPATRAPGRSSMDIYPAPPTNVFNDTE